MKFNIHIQRRRQREGGPSISLFPFLAVLICTMGALVPLLFAITRQARLQAAQAAAAKIVEKKVETQSQREITLWRIKQLNSSRKKTREQVADARLELGHLEDHARRLRQKIPTLEKTAAELDKLGGDNTRQRSEQAEELEILHKQIDVARKQVTDAQTEAASRKQSYAIIPYEGPNQTRRRPIYLECRADAVVLQPEGIELGEADFEGPLGPGNPLAGVLRAVREYWLANRSFDLQRDGEPYPLLLVRPEGIAAYYAARAAMNSWATEFGYELIDADWKLAYQPPDPQLAQVVQHVLLSARARQQRLIAAAPAAYAKKAKATYRASPSRGGSVRVGGSDYNDEDEEDSGYFPRQPSARIGRGYGSAQTDANNGNPPGPTDADRVASLYGNAGGVTSATGRQDQGGLVQGRQGVSQGNGYVSSAIADNGTGGDGPALGAPNGIFASGKATIGGGGSGTIVNRNGINKSAGGTSLGSGSGNMHNGLIGQGGTSGELAADSHEYNTQSGAYAGGNAGIGGYAGGNPGSSGGENNGPYNNATAGGDIGNSSVAGGNTGNNSGSGGIANGNGVANSNGSSGNGGAAGSNNSATGKAGAKSFGDDGEPQTTEQGSSRQPTKLPEGYIIGQPPAEKSESDRVTQSTADQPIGKPVMPLRPGEWQPHEKPPPVQPAEKKPDEKKNSKHQKSLAEMRGRDWALPDAADGSVPITRPIRVECRANELIIVPETGSAGGKSITLGSRTDASMRAFVSAVWEYMDSWGIAGRGMYWRPVLKVYVAPGAEQRFADLQILLAESGLKLERK